MCRCLAIVLVHAMAVGCLCIGGCADRPPLTQAQIDALQARELEAPSTAVFGAVTNALLDSGYQVMVSDPDAGLLTAQKRIDPSPAADAGVITGTLILSVLAGQNVMRDLPPEFHAVSTVVTPLARGRSSLRVQTFVDGVPTLEQEEVEELWVLVQRQILMKEPSRPAPEGGRVDGAGAGGR